MQRARRVWLCKTLFLKIDKVVVSNHLHLRSWQTKIMKRCRWKMWIHLRFVGIKLLLPWRLDVLGADQNKNNSHSHCHNKQSASKTFENQEKKHEETIKSSQDEIPPTSNKRTWDEGLSMASLLNFGGFGLSPRAWPAWRQSTKLPGGHCETLPDHASSTMKGLRDVTCLSWKKHTMM